jgi:phospholipid/cholesterol/gamma-HCH transport system substrate-binding protein
MPAARKVTWAELRVGLVVLAALAVLGAFTFAASLGRNLFTSQTRYVTYLPDVAGLQPGAPVRLVGFSVGSVEKVGLSAFREDPSRHAAVYFVIDSQYANDIRQDSVAFVTTEGLLGQSVLELTRGVQGEAVPADGAVTGTERGSMKQIVQNVEQFTAEISALARDIRKDPKKYLHMKLSLF